MEWSKIKTIIICILLFANLFLLTLIGGQQVRSERYAADAIRQAAETLELNGILIPNVNNLPQSMELPVLAVSRDEGAEAAVAQRLLEGGDMIVNSTGGLSVYSSVSGNVSFRGSGDFSATTQLSWTDYASPEEHARALLRELNIELWSVSSAGSVITVVQTIQGAPVLSTQLVFTYNDTRLVSIEGKLLLGTPTFETEQITPISVPTALVSFLAYMVESGTVCRSIEGMTAGYLAAPTLSDPARLTPCWLVETDTASYLIDASTADILRIS